MPDPKQILASPMRPNNSAEALTVGEYLIGLLEGLWTEGSEFSGKRPFDSSGWETEIEIALISAGCVEGSLDEDGYLEEVDSREASRLILSAISELHKIASGTSETETA